MTQRKRLLLLITGFVLLLIAAAMGYTALSQRSALSPTGDDSGSQEESAPVPAPDFQMETADGTTVTLLETLDGRPAVINFWASTCGPCKTEMPDFQTAFTSYGGDIQFLMVNVGDAMSGETREKAETYLEEEGYTFPVYYDVEYSGVTAYGLRGFPSTFFLDEDGNVAAYASGMLTQSMLADGLAMICPDAGEKSQAG